MERSKTVDQALDLLEELAEGGPGTAQELARRSGRNRTVAYRLLTTLEARGYVRRQGHRYLLGTALLELATRVEAGLRVAARAALDELAARAGETAVLTVRELGEAVAVDQVVSTRQVVQVHYRQGFRHPLHQAAHGKAILAFLPADQAADVLHGAADRSTVEADLERVRHDGYSVSQDELQGGAWGLAAPVRTGEEVIASIGVVAPTQRHPELRTLAGWVLTAADQVSAALGRAPSLLPTATT